MTGQSGNENAVTQQLNEQQLQNPGTTQAANGQMNNGNQMAMAPNNAAGASGIGTPSQANPDLRSGSDMQANNTAPANAPADTATQSGNNGSRTEANTMAPGNSDRMAENNAVGSNMASNNNSSAENRTAAETGNQMAAAQPAPQPVSKAELRRAVSLRHVRNPQQTLATAQVSNRSGEPLGQVRAVDVNTDGTVKDVRADIGQQEVTLDPKNLRYVRDRNVLITDMAAPQMPNTPSTGTSY